MFDIFGFQRKPHRLVAIQGSCASCQERDSQELFSVRTRLRLFFVPAVPLPTTYERTCTACGTSSTVSAEKADLLLASAPRAEEPQVRVAEESAAA